MYDGRGPKFNRAGAQKMSWVRFRTVSLRRATFRTPRHAIWKAFVELHVWAFHSCSMASCYPRFANLFFVPTSVKERVQKLREEIKAISEANRMHGTSGRIARGAAESERERRLERLQEILDELAALTEWKQR